MPQATTRVRFAEFEMDLGSGDIWRTVGIQHGREPVHLPPQAAKLLALLVSNAGSLVDRETLRAQLWGDRWVDWEAGLHQSVRRVRTALGDTREPRRFVETVARRGYRFTAPVVPVVPVAPDNDAVTMAALRAPERPAVRSHLGIAVALALVAVLWVIGSLALSEDETAAEPPDDPIPASARRFYDEALHLASRFQGDAALRRLELAADNAPHWSEPWSAMADLRLDLPGENRVEEARAALEKALARDSDDARAWRALARLRLWEEWDWVGARGALERAIQIDAESADAWQLLAALETVLGREAQALAAAHSAVDLDPVSTVRRADLGWTLYYFGRPEAAVAECRRGLEIDPHSGTAAQCLLQAQLLAVRQRGESPAAGLIEEIRQRLEGGADASSCATPATAALPRLLRGDDSGAVEALLTSARQGRGWDLPFAIVDPLLAPLGADPRLVEVRDVLGLAESRAASSG